MIRILSAVAAPLGALLLAGCGRTTPFVVGSNHPASPEATVAPAPEPSETLALNGSTPPPDGAAARGAATGMGDHSGHSAAAGSPEGAAPTTQPAAGGAYVCPMHPEVTSDDPDARCPKCRMRLVPKESGQ